MAVDFRTLLSKPADEIKRPLPLPAGAYHAVIKSRKFDVSKEKETPYVQFILQPTGPGDGIEPGDLEGVNLASKTLQITYYLTDAADYRLKETADSMGIPTSGRSTGEFIEDMLNQQVLIEVTQRLNPKDPTAPPFNDVANMKGLD